MQTLPIRLLPGQDLRRALQAAVAGSGCGAAFVLAGIGSLSQAQLRFAGAAAPTAITGDLEIITLAGSVAADGCHLHAAVATADGAVVGGHVGFGCTVRTTAEVLLALLPDWHFSRRPDAASGFDELVVTRQPTPAPGESGVRRSAAAGERRHADQPAVRPQQEDDVEGDAAGQRDDVVGR